jgi:hypothetical protein
MAYSIDGPTKTISLTSGTITVSVRDLWSRWVDWFLTSDNSKYALAMFNTGGDVIDAGAGTSIPIYVFLSNGWRIRPQEANHTLNINDGILVVDGGGDPFVNTTGSFIVRINYSQPVQAISFSSTGGGSAPTKEEIRQEIDNNSVKLNELHQLQGLDNSNPMTVNKTSRTVGTINLDIQESGEDIIVTRQ